MAKVKFNSACMAIYGTSLPLPDDIAKRNDYNEIAEYCRDHISEANIESDLEFLSDLEECVTADDICEVIVDDHKDPECLRYSCEEDLSKYTDSMLFDSGEIIASATFKHKGKKLDVDLRIVGEVAVTYKDEVYHRPSEFPDELRSLIEENPNQWMTDDDVYVGLNNWFEYIFDTEGHVLEDDLSKMNSNDVLDDMKELAKWYFDGEKGGFA